MLSIWAAQLAQSPACFYPVMEERGIIRTEAGQTRRIRIEAWDDCGNRSQLEFDILGRTESFRAKADSAATVPVSPIRVKGFSVSLAV